MGKYKRYKNRIEKFLAGEKGKRFFNFAYSLGAAVVILGALFKILHLQGGNFMLSVGMGVEVVMFCLSAFDKPSREYNWEEVFPVLASKNPEDRPAFSGGGTVIVNGGGGGGSAISGEASANVVGMAAQALQEAPTGQTGGAGIQAGGVFPASLTMGEQDARTLSDSIHKLSEAADQLAKMSELTEATQQYFSQLSGISDQMDKFNEVTRSLTEVSSVLLDSYKSITDNSDDVSDHAKGYVNQMESLHRNLTGLNTIYEIQLKSISSQLDTIDRVNAGLKSMKEMYEHSMSDSFRYRQETEKMTDYIAQLNRVYERMLSAMTVNMAGHPGKPSQF